MKQIEFHTTKLLPAVANSPKQKINPKRTDLKKNKPVKTEETKPSFYTKPIFKARKYNIW